MTLGRADADHVRLEVTGTLTFTSAMHSRGSSAVVGRDAPLVRDGLRRPVIPGSSLAGALRAWAETHGNLERNGSKSDRWTVEDVNELFGPPSNPRSGRDDETASSLIVCADTVLDGEETLREGVGINRHTGAAAANFKFDHIVLAPGANGPFRVTCRLPKTAASDDSPVFRAFLACLAALRDSRIPLGGLVTKGFGRCTIRDVKVVKWMSGRDAVLARIRQIETENSAGAAELHLPEPNTEGDAFETSLTLSVEARGPIFSRFAVLGGLVDGAPLVEKRGEDAHIVVSGSSVKGVLRSEAERIMRTVLESDCEADDSLNDQVRVDLVNEVFGTGKIASGSKHDDSLIAQAREQRGALSCQDLTARICTWEKWTKVLAAIEDSARGSSKQDLASQLKALRKALDVADLRAWRVATHVAIDRWTGGAADQRLFSTLEPHGVTWEELHLHLDHRRIQEDRRSAGLVLVVLALSAIHEQRLGLGFGFDRGYGRLKIDKLNNEPFDTERMKVFDKHRDEWKSTIRRMLAQRGLK
jgi:CRISPR/Cas system CSM-associated protein Csm3 (group 7 of RAMP superfamily)